jgi:hypothetical protein
VCGPASSATCTSTTICCINTNGVSTTSIEYQVKDLADGLTPRCKSAPAKSTSLASHYRQRVIDSLGVAGTGVTWSSRGLLLSAPCQVTTG